MNVALAESVAAFVAFVVVEHGVVDVFSDSSASGTAGSTAEQRAYQGTGNSTKQRAGRAGDHADDGTSSSAA